MAESLKHYFRLYILKPMQGTRGRALGKVVLSSWQYISEKDEMCLRRASGFVIFQVIHFGLGQYKCLLLVIEWHSAVISYLLIFRHCSVVDQRMIVEEESAGNVEGNKDVDAVVLMCRQDEEDAKAVEQPSEGVEKVDSATCVLGDEEVQ